MNLVDYKGSSGYNWTTRLENCFKDDKKGVLRLFREDYVTNNYGIYEYSLSGDIHLINKKALTFAQNEAQKCESRQEKEICVMNLMHSAQLKSNHITPWR